MVLKNPLFWLLALSVIPTSYAQSDSLFVIPKIDGITFDGRVDEPAWNLISPVPMVQYEPNAGSQPTEKRKSDLPMIISTFMSQCGPMTKIRRV